MQIAEEILEKGLTQSVCVVAIASALIYIWKRYEKLLKDKAKSSVETYSLVKLVQDISNDTKKAVENMDKTVLDLHEEVSKLDSRLKDLERLGFTDQTNINSLLKDIETIKKYLEIYNMTLAINHNQPQSISPISR